MKRPLVVVALLAQFLAPMASADPNTNVMVGAGATSCGQWIEVKNEDFETVEKIFVSWVQGFLSGMNIGRDVASKKMLFLPEPPAISAYVDKYCRDNPLDDIAKASAHLYLELQHRQQ